MLKEGKNIAIVSDAGTPGISDPGEVIVKKCIEENIDLKCLQGQLLLQQPFVYSGLDTKLNLFLEDFYLEKIRIESLL